MYIGKLQIIENKIDGLVLCTLRLTFYLPSAAVLEHFCKLLKIKRFALLPKSRVFVASQTTLARSHTAFD